MGDVFWFPCSAWEPAFSRRSASIWARQSVAVGAFPRGAWERGAFERWERGGNANLPIGNWKRAANQEIGDPAREKRIMRTRFSPKRGKFPTLPVRQKPFAGLQLRKSTSPHFPFLRYPRQQRIGKRTILVLAPQRLTCGGKQPEFCAVLGVGRTIREVGTSRPTRSGFERTGSGYFFSMKSYTRT